MAAPAAPFQRTRLGAVGGVRIESQKQPKFVVGQNRRSCAIGDEQETPDEGSSGVYAIEFFNEQGTMLKTVTIEGEKPAAA